VFTIAHDYTFLGV